MIDRIPKIIHYCWFGNNVKPNYVINYINSWKKYCSSYEFREWNESNFDINSNQYVKEAYENRKWAFVTDYVRLKVLYEFGGIYMDTDIEVLKPLDEFLVYPAFSGFEFDNKISTGIMGAEKGSLWIGNLLKDYDNRRFLKPDGSFDMTTNVELITDNTRQLYNIELNNRKQETKDFVLFPFDCFCAKKYYSNKIYKTKNTYAIHHFSGTWMSGSQKIKMHLTGLIGKSGMKFLSNIKQFILKRI